MMKFDGYFFILHNLKVDVLGIVAIYFIVGEHACLWDVDVLILIH